MKNNRNVKYLIAKGLSSKTVTSLNESQIKILVEKFKKEAKEQTVVVTQVYDSKNPEEVKKLNEYLNLCRFEPVTFGDGDASNPEEGKIKAMRNFISYCKEMAQEIGEKAFFKNDIVNNEYKKIICFIFTPIVWRNSKYLCVSLLLLIQLPLLQL